MNIKTKYEVRQKAWHIVDATKEVKIPCFNCVGTGMVPSVVKCGMGDYVDIGTIKCPVCGGNKFVKATIPNPSVEVCYIVEIGIAVRSDGSYETGYKVSDEPVEEDDSFYGRYYEELPWNYYRYEWELFSTEQEALEHLEGSASHTKG